MIICCDLGTDSVRMECQVRWHADERCGPSEAVEQVNRKLKQLLAEATLDKQGSPRAAGKKLLAPAAWGSWQAARDKLGQG